MRRLLSLLAVASLAAVAAPSALAHHGGGQERTTIVGTSADNTLTGTDGPDWIKGRGGNDTVLAGAGDDIVNLVDRSAGDRVDCGAGTDTVFIDAGDQASNCETVKTVAAKRCARHHSRKARAAHFRHGRDCRGDARRRR